MAKPIVTYQRIKAYLNNLLSNKERHALEKEVLRDPFEEDALEGLETLLTQEQEADLSFLKARINDRVNKKTKRNYSPIFKIAASVLIIFGLGGLFYLLKTDSSLPEMVEHTESKNDATDYVLIDPREKTIEKDITKKNSIEKPIDSTQVVVQEHSETSDFNSATQPLKTEPTISKTKVEQINKPIATKALSKETSTSEAKNTPKQHYSIEEDIKAEESQDYEEELVNTNATRKSELTEAVNDIKSKKLMRSNRVEEPLQQKPSTPYSPTSGNAQSKVEKTNSSAIPPNGDIDAFKLWITNQLKPKVFKSKKNYTIKISFIVSIDGTLNTINVLTKHNRAIDKEIKRVLTSSSNWLPAYDNGIAVPEKTALQLEVLFE